MRGERRRLNLSLAMDTETQRQAWEIVSAVPRGQRTEAICRMLLEHRSQIELLQAIHQAVREELEAYGGPPAKQKNIAQPPKAGEVRNDILGFLRGLQEGEDVD